MIEQVRALCDRIRAHPLLRLDRFDVAPALAPAEIDRLQKESGRVLPEAFRKLYGEANGCRLEWSVDHSHDPPAAEALAGALRERRLAFDGQAEPLGRIALVTLQDLLSGDAYLEFDESVDAQIDFAGASYREGDFLKGLRPFDAVDDAMLTAAVTSDPNWTLLLLTGNWAEFDGSRLIDVTDYLQIMTDLWGLRMARDVVLGKYRGDRDSLVTAAEVRAAELLPPALTAAPAA
jgi:hypothetical protein